MKRKKYKAKCTGLASRRGESWLKDQWYWVILEFAQSIKFSYNKTSKS